jgi:hypothetical protein
VCVFLIPMPHVQVIEEIMVWLVSYRWDL